MPSRKMKEFLDNMAVKYVKITHSPAYTAREIAQSVHIKGKDVAKTIIVFIEGKMAMAVLSANYSIDFDYFRKEIGAKTIELASIASSTKSFSMMVMAALSNLMGWGESPKARS